MLSQSDSRPYDGQKVLYLEEEPIVCMLHHEMLGGFDCRVTACTMPAHALEAVMQASFDVAILDVNVHRHASYPVAELLVNRGTDVAFSPANSLQRLRTMGRFPLLREALHGG
jgi:CheY-like chemotaxis protein